jgi:N-acetylglucosamine kinase-like BadF-type ATPase
VLMAGADLPAEELELQAAVERRGWAERPLAGNDTLAVLRAGTERAWGVAVVCGTGINCVGVGPDGSQVRFPALGLISGDWGGGYDVGLAGLTAAARASDGRGPATSLERAVPAYFGLDTPLDVAEAIHLGRLERGRLGELTRVVWAECAAGDGAATAILDQLAGEVVDFARAAIERLRLGEEPVEVVLGGTLLRTAPARLVERVSDELRPALVVLPDSPPITGAALLALDDLAAQPEAKERVREEVTLAAASLAGSDADG